LLIHNFKVGNFYIVCLQNCNPRIVEEEVSQTAPKVEGKEEKKVEDEK